MAYCEDYPCCGHTREDPCERQWYDEPGAFDTSKPGNEHALCDHPNGDCLVPEPDDELPDDEGDQYPESDEPEDFEDEEPDLSLLYGRNSNDLPW